MSRFAQKGHVFRAEVAGCCRGLVAGFHALVALSFQRSVSENSLVAMDFSGQTGRVIENPAEAQSAALEEGHAWRVSRGRSSVSLAGDTPQGWPAGEWLYGCRRGRVLGGEAALRSPWVGGWHCGGPAPRECLATPYGLRSPGPQVPRSPGRLSEHQESGRASGLVAGADFLLRCWWSAESTQPAPPRAPEVPTTSLCGLEWSLCKVPVPNLQVGECHPASTLS